MGWTGAGCLSFEPVSTALYLYSTCGCGMKSSRSLPPPPFAPGFSKKSRARNKSRRLRASYGGGGPGDASESKSSSRRVEDWMLSPSPSPYHILGVDPDSCSPAQLKAAFRARVKEFHPDVCQNSRNSDAIIRRVIKAYEILSKSHQDNSTERSCLDPFEEPECEAYDLFVNEILCVGKGCPYSCVKRAPHAFSFTCENGTARAISQGHGDDYLIQLAVGQCPRRCIHYVTPTQRVILEDLLESVLNAPYDLADAAMLDSLISKATFENNRYQKPKRQIKVSTEYVDWC